MYNVGACRRLSAHVHPFPPPLPFPVCARASSPGGGQAEIDKATELYDEVCFSAIPEILHDIGSNELERVMYVPRAFLPGGVERAVK
jgi:hypothetical protein